MAEKEIIFTIPLRKELLKVPRYKRAKKAVNAVREFLKKHMKSENVKIGKYLNKKILERGRKNPLHKIQVKVVKEGNIVKAELVGAPVEEKKEEEKGKKPKKKEKEKVEEKKEEREKEEEKVKESEKEEKKKILEKGLEKEEKPEEKRKVEDKEEAVMTGEEKIYRKTDKPHHEKKK